MDDFEKAFERNLAGVRQGWRYRLLQKAVTFRHRALPYMAGLVPGSLLADKFYPGKGDENLWVMVAFGVAGIITPVVYAFTRKDRDFTANRVFYLEALKRTLLERRKRP